MSGISTHVLDTGLGRPAAGVAVRLEFRTIGEWVLMATTTTDEDGRVAELLAGPLDIGEYRIGFDIAGYRDGAFFPEVLITFRVTTIDEHHHVPLLLSPFGYTTYRGS